MVDSVYFKWSIGQLLSIFIALLLFFELPARSVADCSCFFNHRRCPNSSQPSCCSLPLVDLS